MKIFLNFWQSYRRTNFELFCFTRRREDFRKGTKRCWMVYGEC